MLIGELAAKSGFSRDTIRYYEKLGLIQVDKLNRGANNYKNYSSYSLERLVQIAHFKDLGFTLTEISGLLTSFEGKDAPCVDLPSKLKDKISMFDDKIALLEKYKSKLLVVQQACDGGCSSSTNLPDCFSQKPGEEN